MNYLCSWEINVEADSPEEAAQEAERLMTNRRQSTWSLLDEQGGHDTVNVTPGTGEILED